jgi:hypothetical protein
MSVTGRLNRAALDPGNPRSISGRARARRWNHFIATFPDISEMRVLDLGGLPNYWRTAPVRPAQVVTLNLSEDCADEPWMEHVVGDACEPPERITAERFDLVVSNSLLEHVGGHQRRRRLAEQVFAVGDRNWIQTPYRYFPVEPHWLFPGFQFLPVPARVVLSRLWPLGQGHAEDYEGALAAVQEVELIGITEMRSYFPGTTIWIERFGRLPKSLISIRS